MPPRPKQKQQQRRQSTAKNQQQQQAIKRDNQPDPQQQQEDQHLQQQRKPKQKQHLDQGDNHEPASKFIALSDENKQEIIHKDIQEMLENDLNCAICRDIYINPLILNCSHSFCKFCVIHWLSKQTGCPTCRMTVTFQAENLALRNIINRMIQKSSQQYQTSRASSVSQRLEDEEQQVKDGVVPKMSLKPTSTSNSDFIPVIQTFRSNMQRGSNYDGMFSASFWRGINDNIEVVHLNGSSEDDDNSADDDDRLSYESYSSDDNDDDDDADYDDDDEDDDGDDEEEADEDDDDEEFQIEDDANDSDESGTTADSDGDADMDEDYVDLDVTGESGDDSDNSSGGLAALYDREFSESETSMSEDDLSDHGDLVSRTLRSYMEEDSEGEEEEEEAVDDDSDGSSSGDATEEYEVDDFSLSWDSDGLERYSRHSAVEYGTSSDEN